MKKLFFFAAFFPAFFAVASAQDYRSERNDLIQLRDSLQSAMNLHANWTGPPCHESWSRWIGITCLNSNVVGIDLAGIQLTGMLGSDAFQNVMFLSHLNLSDNAIHGELPTLGGLVGLQVIDFSGNRFSGEIPFKYTTLPQLTSLKLQNNLLNGTIPPFNQQSLTSLNLSFNFLHGTIPDTPVLRKFPASSFDQNLDLCGPSESSRCTTAPATSPSARPGTNAPPSTSTRHQYHHHHILAPWSAALMVIGAALLPLMALCVLFYRSKISPKTTLGGHSDQMENKMDLEFFDKEKALFTRDMLLRSRAESIGKGSLGINYRVTLENGQTIVVKRLRNMSTVGQREFLQNLQLLGRLRNEYIVEIISCHHSKEEKLVIYEHTHGCSLLQLIHGNRGGEARERTPLGWAARLSIVKGIARGLAYIHMNLSSHKVPHGNLKSSNVIVLHRHHQKYHPKITDYGFQPLLQNVQKLAVAKAPEFSWGRKLNSKADIFCFGLVMLEVITGRSPCVDDESDLSQWAKFALMNEWSTDILDEEILDEKECHGDMLKLTELALECTAAEPAQRPAIGEVLRKIEDIKELEERTNCSSKCNVSSKPNGLVAING